MSHTDCTEDTEEEPNSALQMVFKTNTNRANRTNSPVGLAACDDKHKPYKTNSLTPNPSPRERGVIRLEGVEKVKG